VQRRCGIDVCVPWHGARKPAAIYCRRCCFPAWSSRALRWTNQRGQKCTATRVNCTSGLCSIAAATTPLSPVLIVLIDTKPHCPTSRSRSQSQYAEGTETSSVRAPGPVQHVEALVLQGAGA
jgi:hypothetical protein